MGGKRQRTKGARRSRTHNERVRTWKKHGMTELTETADETHLKYCSNCGKNIEKPVLFQGYVFCSEQCRESFTTRGGRDLSGKRSGARWQSKREERAAG
jgi:hypothetical protein